MENQIVSKISEYGPIALIFVFFIYMYFQSVKDKNKEKDTLSLSEQMRIMNSNHLTHIQEYMRQGVESGKRNIEQHDRQIELLSEIKGHLSK